MQDRDGEGAGDNRGNERQQSEDQSYEKTRELESRAQSGTLKEERHNLNLGFLRFFKTRPQLLHSMKGGKYR